MHNALARRPYVATVIDPEMLALSQTLLREGDRAGDARRSHFQAYQAFCEVNNLDPIEGQDYATPIFAASLILQARSESTVKVYLRHIQGELRDGPRPVNLVIRALDARTAEKGTAHAMDLSDDKIRTLLHAAYYRVCARSAIILAFMWFTGLRCQDLFHLRGRQVEWGGSYLRIEVRIAKNIHARLERTELRLPRNWIPPMGSEFGEAITDFITTRCAMKDELMFGAPKVTEVNAILARAWEECGSLPAQGKDHKHPTTYTLRRSFVRAIIKRCTRRRWCH